MLLYIGLSGVNWEEIQIEKLQILLKNLYYRNITGKTKSEDQIPRSKLASREMVCFMLGGRGRGRSS